jgi:hypothetical protein
MSEVTEVTEVTVEQIAQHYKAMGDSVTLINAGQPEGMSNEDWVGKESRNKEHLSLMLTKDFWTDEDMSEVEAAISA